MLPDYKERISYDPNGNIQAYLRNGNAARLQMDDLTYHYKAGTNQLDKVADAAPDAASGDYDKYKDLKQGQQTGNYTYDAIGNLISDASEGISSIDWTVYGKIASVTKSSGTISYSYNASGNRISKAAGSKQTFYVRDASGNVIGVYEKETNTALKKTESHLYGSSRLGVAGEETTAPVSVALAVGYDNGKITTFTRGETFFELSNHLGNVLATVSDRKLPVTSTNGEKGQMHIDKGNTRKEVIESENASKLSKEEIQDRVHDKGICVATDKITVDGLEVGYMYREEPGFENDSRWCFFVGTEEQDYVDDPNNSMIRSLNMIANYDPAIIPYLSFETGVQLERGKDNKFNVVA